MHYPSIFRSIFFAFVEILTFFLPLAIISVVGLSTGGSKHEVLYSSDWWFVVVLILFDALRDTARAVRRPEPKSLDHRVYINLVGSLALGAMAFLVLTAVSTRKPDLLAFPDWFATFQWGFLIAAIVLAWALKAGLIYEELKPSPVS